MTRNVHVLCEGFHDRDFLAGWFEFVARWNDPTHGGKRPVQLFGEERVPKGAFLFDGNAGGTRICLVPCGGREQLAQRFGKWLDEVSKLGPLTYSDIVVVADGDHLAGDPTDPVESLVRQELAKAGSPPTGELPWRHRSLGINFASMRAGVVDDVVGLHEQECLERVVCAAFARAHPVRYRSMLDWLNGREEPSGSAQKAMNWSIMAGWFADQGPTDFLRRAIWNDLPMRGELGRVLAATGLATVEQRLTSG
jgi:hypothetical protein